MPRRTIGALTLLFALAQAPLHAQAQKQAPRDEGCPETPSYPCGALRRPSPDAAARIIQALRTRKIANWADDVLVPYFGPLYDKNYVDWVVFIDAKQNSVRQGLFRNGKFVPDDRLKGDDNVWVVVFSTSKLKLPKAERDAREAQRASDLQDAATECADRHLQCRMDLTLDGENPTYVEDDDDGAILHLKREVIKHAPDPVLASAFRALAGGLLGDAVKEESVNDTSYVMKFDSLATTPIADGGDTLFAGAARVKMPDDAIVRLSLRPGKDRTIPDNLGVFRNLANGRYSKWLAGLAVAGAFNVSEPKFSNDTVVGATDPFRAALLLYVGRTIYSSPPTTAGGSVSLVGGTNIITGDLFRDLFLGLSISTSNNLSVLGGLDYAQLLEKGRSDQKQINQRRVRLMVGLGLSIR